MRSSALVLTLFFACAFADVYLHMPRGCNDRLNERSAERNNGNRLFDSQNNARGGYNVGDKTSRPFNENNPYLSPDPTTSINYMYTLNYSTGQDMQYAEVYFEGSDLYFEWTNQHGCGGDELTNPQRQNCNIIIEYMCDTDTDPTGEYRLTVELKNGGNTNTPNDPTLYTDIPSTKTNNDNNQFGRHESEGWYYACSRDQRNYGLFHADQNLGGNDARFTRQNNNGNRRGLECPEERDYYPYWRPVPWRQIAYMTDHVEHCPMVEAESQNVATKYFCKGLLPLPPRGDGSDVIPITQAACEARNGTWTGYTHGIPPPYCGPAAWSRDNHLGNGVNGEFNNYKWTLPSFQELASTGVKIYNTVHGPMARCIARLRYNISTDDYDPWTANSSMDDDGWRARPSPIEQNPWVDPGTDSLVGLRLAINTNQFGRTFQDRSHIFHVRPRPASFGTRPILNLNVRGKRGNIVQTYPSVTYDFVPTRLEGPKALPANTLVHVQWVGSNTHNNGNPGGDGQTGDAGEGSDGTDRHNFVQYATAGDNYPLPLDASPAVMTALDVVSFWQNVDCLDWSGNSILGATDGWVDCALAMATSGQYRSRSALTANGATWDPTMDSAPASFNQGLVLSFKSSFPRQKKFYYASTRNNHFGQLGQRGIIEIV